MPEGRTKCNGFLSRCKERRGEVTGKRENGLPVCQLGCLSYITGQPRFFPVRADGGLAHLLQRRSGLPADQKNSKSQIVLPSAARFQRSVMTFPAAWNC